MPHLRPRGRSTSWIASTFLFATVAACTSTDNVDALRDQPPAPLIVLVEWAPPTLVEGASEARDAVPADVRYGGVVADTTVGTMRELLAQELRALNASSRVVTPRELGDMRPDVTIRFVPSGPIQCEHVGTSRFLAAGGLWLVTWLGGLLVDDSAYSVAMDASCRFEVSQDDSFESRLTSDEVELSFFDRNDLVSLSTLQSLILPPFWTSDQTGKTSEALSREAMRIAARQIAGQLKNDFEERAASQLSCSIRFAAPVNGQRVSGASMPVELVAISNSAEPISRITAVVNDGQPIDLGLGEAIDRGYRVRGELTGLDPNRVNFVRVEVLADRKHTRTLRLEAAR